MRSDKIAKSAYADCREKRFVANSEISLDSLERFFRWSIFPLVANGEAGGHSEISLHSLPRPREWDKGSSAVEEVPLESEKDRTYVCRNSV